MNLRIEYDGPTKPSLEDNLISTLDKFGFRLRIADISPKGKRIILFRRILPWPGEEKNEN